MRDRDSPLERFLARTLAGLALVVITLLGAAGGPIGGVVGLIIGATAAYYVHQALSRAGARRRQALATPFPDEWRRLLHERFAHYRRLPPELRETFEKDVRLFLAAKRINGVRMEIDEELRLLVAASAVTLSVGWPLYEWDRLGEVLLYPDNFDRDYGHDERDIAGLAHPLGTVVLSAPALEHSFANPTDAFHVGIHEFAHILDLEGQGFDGIPADIDSRGIEIWGTIAQREMLRLRQGRSIIDDYGSQNQAEFLAVSIEAFFEVPVQLRRNHGELYDFLAAYFGQDPAEWEAGPDPAVSIN